MSELEKESHTEEPKASDPPTTRNWPVWLVLAVVSSLVLAAAAAWLLYLHKRQTQKVALDYQHSFLAFKEETQEFFNDALASFAKAHSAAPDPGIKLDESAIDSEIYQRGESESTECPLHFEKGRLVYELSGFSENDKRGWDKRWSKWSADPFDQLRGYSASKPLFMLVTDETGEIVLTAGRSTILPPKRQLAEWITQSRGDDKKAAGKSEEIPFQAYTVLHQEVLIPSIWSNQLQLPSKPCPSDILHVFGLVATDQIFRDSLELARGPMIALCFTLFLLVLSFPFLKLFFAPEERFRRVDAVLLLLCGALLVATIVFSGILGASLTSLQDRDDSRLNSLSTNLRGELKGRDWSNKESKLLSIKDPLPWGMGFAVLDQEANSLGHSDSLHSAFEEITSESGQGKLLRGALRSGSEEPFTIISMGRPERVKMVPLEPSKGEKLLVFREQEPLQSIRLYTSLVTLLIATSCMLLLVTLGTLLGRLVRRPLLLTSFWPHRSRGSLYLRLTLAYLLLGALELRTILHFARWNTVLVAILVPAIAVPWTLWVLAGRPGLINPVLRPVAWIFSLSFAAVLIWICFGAFSAWWSWPLLAVPIALETAFRLPDWGIPRRYGLSLYSGAVLALLLLSTGLPTLAVYRAAFLEEDHLLANLSQNSLLASPEGGKVIKKSSSPVSGRRSATKATPQEEKQSEQNPSEGELLINSGYAALRNLDNDYTALTLAYLNNPLTAGTDLTTMRCREFRTGLLPPGGWKRILWLIILALGLIGAFALTSASVYRLFGSDLVASRLDPEKYHASRVLWAAPRGSGHWIAALEGLEGVKSCDLDEIARLGIGTLETWSSKNGMKTLLVRDFGETWPKVGGASRRLQAIQKLLEHWRQGIWLISEVVPEYIAAASDPQGQSLRELLGSGFLVIHPHFTEIRACADADPEKIWRTLTADEQRVCQQVAQAGYFRLGEAASSVGHYGLLEAHSVPKLVSRTFQSFVQRKSVKLGENGKVPAKGWASLRWALVLGLSVFLALLFFTQADSFKAISTAITAVGIALAGLWKIGDYLSPSRSGSSAKADVGGGA